MWVIDHPKGLVVFDTGNNVAITENCKAYWAAGLCDFLKPSQKRADTIDMQLKKLGYSTDQVKVVVTSHSHLDHAGNLKMFPNAIHVFQKAELFQGWWPEQFQGRAGKGPFVLADLEGTREFNFLELDGDYDLYGDGSIQILSTPGHTIGHQSIKLSMKSGNSYILSQDAIWMKENLEGYPAGLNFSVQTYTNSVNRLKFMSDLQGVPIFMPHDQDQYAAKGGRWYK
jgi:glyoxylase-like metal-dependent hydrolase (beta-lactamase superfamily II)